MSALIAAIAVACLRLAKDHFLQALCRRGALRGLACRLDLGDLARQLWHSGEGTNYSVPSKVICGSATASWNKQPLGAERKGDKKPSLVLISVHLSSPFLTPAKYTSRLGVANCSRIPQPHFHPSSAAMSSEVKTEFLVVGAGPAGAALASFLGQNGVYDQGSREAPRPDSSC